MQGVWLARLDTLTDADLVPEAIASALDVGKSQGCSLLDSLVEAIAGGSAAAYESDRPLSW